jgi:hypothetical protein
MDGREKIPPYFDAWVLAKALAGHTLNGEVSKVTEANRPIAERLATAPIEERKSVWDAHLATLEDERADELSVAVARSDPNDLPPATDDDWDEPFAFRLPPVEPFPLDVYPVQVGFLIEQGAVAVGCSPDFLAMPVLAVASAAIGRSAALKLKDGYVASASVYIVNISVAGDGKSPALKAVVKPLEHIDQCYDAEFRKEMIEYEKRLAEYEAENRFDRSSRGTSKNSASRRQRGSHGKQEDLDDSSDSSNDKPSGSSVVVELGLSKPERPTLRRTVVRDITIEALDAVLAENPRGVIQVVDEASSLVTSMNQYRGGKGSDRQSYLSIWSSEPRTLDRKSNQDRVPIRISHPFLSIVGGLVPANVGMLGEGRNDGFLDRFLFAYPDPVPKAGWRDEGVTAEVAIGWEKLVVRLRSLPMVQRDTHPEPQVIRLSLGAKKAWRELINAHHAEQSGADFADSLRGHWSKLEQYAGRITLILHMLDWAGDTSREVSLIPDVPAQTVRKAGRLLEYLKSHIRRVHAVMTAKAHGHEGSDEVQSIMKWIYRHRRESFTRRDLTRDLTNIFGGRSRSLEDALSWLMRQNCLRRLDDSAPPQGRPGRKASAVYRVNPRLFSSQKCQNRNSKSAPADQGHHFHDFGNSAGAQSDCVGEEASDDCTDL